MTYLKVSVHFYPIQILPKYKLTNNFSVFRFCKRLISLCSIVLITHRSPYKKESLQIQCLSLTSFWLTNIVIEVVIFNAIKTLIVVRYSPHNKISRDWTIIGELKCSVSFSLISVRRNYIRLISSSFDCFNTSFNGVRMCLEFLSR